MSTSKPHDYRFHVDDSDPRRLNRHALANMLRRLGNRAGVKNVHPHRFRHTFATKYLRNNG